MQRTRTPLLVTLLLTVACSGSKPDTAQPDPQPDPGDTPAADPVAEVDPIPDGWFELTPQLVVDDVDAAMEFYAKAFAAEKVLTLPGPDGKTMHGEVKIGDSIIMIDLANGPMKSAKTLGGSPVSMMIYSASADEVFATAIAAGAKETMPLEAQFWGDKFGQVVDPFGHQWGVAMRLEDLTDEQVKQRSDIMMAEMAKAAGKKKKKKKKGEPAWKTVEGKPAAAAVPPEYHTVTMGIVVPDAKAAVEFYGNVFGGTQKNRLDMPDGKIMHVEVRIGSSALMISDELPQFGSKSAKTLGGSPVMVHHYTTDADATFKKATDAGANAVWPLGDVPWGDYYGAVVAPDGIAWGIATHKEDLTPEQVKERMDKYMAEQAAAKAGGDEPAEGGDKPAEKDAAAPAKK